METPTQGTMLSERPSGSLGGGSSGSAANGGGSAPLTGAGSIGNYKGVMLCNRPFAGTAAASKGGGGDGSTASGKHVFITGKVKSQVGFAGKNLQTEKLLRKRVKQETALTRHRRWLADLQLTKQVLEEKYMEDLQKKKENKRRFAEREARMRQMTRELALGSDSGGGGSGSGDFKHCTGDGGGKGVSTAAPPHGGSSLPRDQEERGGQAWAIGLDDNGEDSGKRTAAAGESEEVRCSGHFRQPGGQENKQGSDEDNRLESRPVSVELRAVEKRRKRDGKPCRPMWAMTETKADEEAERKHEEELEELLEFTQGLDFSKYIRDVEVQTMIDQVKKRIQEIEGQPEVDEGALEDDCNEDEGDGERSGRPLEEAEARLEAKIMRLTDKALREIAAIDSNNDDAGASCQNDGNNNRREDDNISVARTAISEGGRSVRSVHSTRSLASVAERARENIAAKYGVGVGVGVGNRRSCGAVTAEEAGSGRSFDSENNEGPVNDILVRTHQDDGGLRRGGKNTVSNLPYIRRNPAV